MNVDADEQVVSATLERVRRCPAREDYIELCFSTPLGPLKWCFPEPEQRRTKRRGPLVLALGRYGLQARLRREDGLGPALTTDFALPMILDGAEVEVARELVLASV